MVGLTDDVWTSIRTLMPRLFRITKNVSEGVVNAQIQCVSPWTWIDVSSTYRIRAPRILLKIASYSDVMRNFVLSDDDRRRLRNFLDNLRFYSKRKTKLCSAIRASFCCYVYLPIRRGKRPRYAFMPIFLARLSFDAFILIFSAVAATS